jgi:membrane-bound lytic murein transglycosylase A
VVLTPGRSLAVDRRWLPLSLPLWVETEVPEPFAENSARWRRLMIAQDTGGAIRGPVRGDIYFGDSAAAADQAGRMKGRGGYTVLIPRGPVERGELPPPILPMASR